MRVPVPTWDGTGVKAMNRIHTALVGCAAIAALAPVSSAQVRLRTVAVSGQQAPGQPPAVQIAFFGSAPGATAFNSAPVRIDEHGNVAFSAGLNPGAAGAVLKEVNGQLQLVARKGDPAPGGGTFDIDALFNST